MTINSNWPYVTVIAFLAAIAYAALVMYLNHHRRVGTFWSNLSWLEVVVGNSLVAATIWALVGLDFFLLAIGVNVLWGAPMIVGALVMDMRARVRADDEQIAAE
jgi:hypothetical protein